MSEHNPEYMKLVKYVNAASDLAESVTRDIKKGKKISSQTVVHLSKFVTASHLVQKMIDQIEQTNYNLN